MSSPAFQQYARSYYDISLPGLGPVGPTGTITDIDPSRPVSGFSGTMRITGTGLANAMSVRIGSVVTSTFFVPPTDTDLQPRFNVNILNDVGAHPLEVLDGSGNVIAVNPTFEVLPPGNITSISPTTADHLVDNTFTVTGTGLSPTTDVTAQSKTFIPTSITDTQVVFTVPAASPLTAGSVSFLLRSKPVGDANSSGVATSPPVTVT